MDKLVIFAGADLFSPRIFIQEIFRIMKNRKDIVLAGVVDTGKFDPPAKTKRILEFLAINTAVKVFNAEIKIPIKTTSPVNLYDLCRKHDIKVIVPPGRNVNSREFVNFLGGTLQPTLGLSVGCLQIFKKPLIDIFEVFVNYHDGLLPQYKGLNATKWSRYLNEDYTGFTYHLINESIDDGNILMQGSIQIPESIPFFELEYRKTIEAKKSLAKVIELMLQRNSGITQKGSSRYFGRKDFEAITTINSPSQVTYDELQKRLLVFGAIKCNINGRYYPATKFMAITDKRSGSSKKSFVTRNNITVKPKRILYLPVALYKFYEYIQKLYSHPV